MPDAVRAEANRPEAAESQPKSLAQQLQQKNKGQSGSRTEEPKQKLMNQLAITYVQLQLFFKNSVKIKLCFHILILGSNSETQTFLYNTDSVSHD